MVRVSSARSDVALSYSGEIYNFQELRKELVARGHRFTTGTDTEVVLVCYLEWGEDFVHKLAGMYAFALWDQRAKSLLLVRDRLGIKPLYYARLGDGLAFGSEVKALLTHPEISVQVNYQGLADALGFIRTPSLTPLNDIAEVAPGHYLRITQRGVERRQYWTLSTTAHTHSLGQTIESVRMMFEQSVEEQLVADVPLCALLSGGLDSSAIAAVANSKWAATKPECLRSFSLDFADSEDEFVESDFRPERDNPYAIAAAKHIGTDHRTIVLDSEILAQEELGASVLRAMDFPITFGDGDNSLFLLFEKIREHGTVALSGESADEIFGGYVWFREHAEAATARFPWLSRIQFIEPELLNPEFRSFTDFEAYQNDCYRSAVGQVQHLDNDSLRDRNMRQLSYLHLTRLLPVLLDRKDRLSMAHGLEVRVPFCDHRLIEYVYNVPWQLKTYDSREKSLLRGAMLKLLPQTVLSRQKSAYPTTGAPSYAQVLCSRAADVVTNKDSPAWDIVSRNSIQGLLTRPTSYFNSQRRRHPLETAIALDRWFSYLSEFA